MDRPDGEPPDLTKVAAVMRPRDISAAIRRQRAATLVTFDSLGDADLDQPALPGWTVADVFRHLADSDRGSVLGVHLKNFLPGRTLKQFEEEFEQVNDQNLERLRAADRATLRRELEVWGARLARIVALVPGPLARLRVPTAFGRLPLGWLGCLRPYDEWVHRWDIAQALGQTDPLMDQPIRDLLAEFHLRALPAGPLREAELPDGLVEVRIDDGQVWRFDLGRRHFGAHVLAHPTVTVHLGVPDLCLIAANRTSWQDVEASGRLKIEGDDRTAAQALLDLVRVV